MPTVTQFQNRTEAGKLLAQKLSRYKNSNAVVYALPRGGVVVGAQIASTLKLPLSIVLVAKIGHPYSSEYALGACTENGSQILNEQDPASHDKKWLNQEVPRQREKLQKRRMLYLQGKQPLSAQGKIAILVDDGVATGYTLKTALVELKKQHPRKLVIAIPVAPLEFINEIKKDVDEIVCLLSDPNYRGAVGAYYNEFSQIEDEDVITLLQNQP